MSITGGFVFPRKLPQSLEVDEEEEEEAGTGEEGTEEWRGRRTRSSQGRPRGSSDPLREEREAKEEGVGGVEE